MTNSQESKSSASAGESPTPSVRKAGPRTLVEQGFKNPDAYCTGHTRFAPRFQLIGAWCDHPKHGRIRIERVLGSRLIVTAVDERGRHDRAARTIPSKHIDGVTLRESDAALDAYRDARREVQVEELHGDELFASWCGRLFELLNRKLRRGTMFEDQLKTDCFELASQIYAAGMASGYRRVEAAVAGQTLAEFDAEQDAAEKAKDAA